MQTFLPFPSFEKSAQVLDYKRLGKQRAECKQIYIALSEGSGWSNHPAVKMWAGYEPALIIYAEEICKEWINRGYKDTVLSYFENIEVDYVCIPWWLGFQPFHLSHQSNLIRKDEEFYRPLFAEDVPNDLPYYWPVNSRGEINHAY